MDTLKNMIQEMSTLILSEDSQHYIISGPTKIWNKELEELGGKLVGENYTFIKTDDNFTTLNRFIIEVKNGAILPGICFTHVRDNIAHLNRKTDKPVLPSIYIPDSISFVNQSSCIQLIETARVNIILQK